MACAAYIPLANEVTRHRPVVIENVSCCFHLDITIVVFVEKHLRDPDFYVLFVARPASVAECCPAKIVFIILLRVISEDSSNLFTLTSDIPSKEGIFEIMNLNDFCFHNCYSCSFTVELIVISL